jgi:hypothetical protein
MNIFRRGCSHVSTITFSPIHYSIPGALSTSFDSAVKCLYIHSNLTILHWRIYGRTLVSPSGVSHTEYVMP